MEKSDSSKFHYKEASAPDMMFPSLEGTYFK